GGGGGEGAGPDGRGEGLGERLQPDMEPGADVGVAADDLAFERVEILPPLGERDARPQAAEDRIVVVALPARLDLAQGPEDLGPLAELRQRAEVVATGGAGRPPQDAHHPAGAP